MLAGISGATPGSTGSGEELEDSEGRLKLLHPAKNIVSADVIAKLATLRALPDPIIAFPRAISWPLPSSSQS